MPKFKQTAEILKLMSRKENIRNIGIIAHIDHGKTTMTDSLLAGAGLLSPTVAGEARVLDYLEEEQKRGITIKTANISLLHEMDGQPYIINMVDTPGHVDFTGKVTRALRATDGAIVVVDAVEEVMVQTETVTRQALEERVKPVLFINKVDRLIKELKLAQDEIQNKFTRIVQDFNNIIEIYGEPEFKDKWKVDPTKENVAFGSALHKWSFTLNIAQKKGMRFNEIVEAYANDKHQTLSHVLPIHETILNMVIRNIPNPIEAQNYRVPKIWKGEIDSELGKAMLKCDDDGPTVMCMTNAQIDPHAGLIATGRLFSGSVKERDQVYLVSAKKEHFVKQVLMSMGAFKENVEKISAGNIAALSGLEMVRTGETLVDTTYRNAIVPFERIKYVSEPIMTIAVEPRNPKDLPVLMDTMYKLSTEDPNLVTTVNEETGQCLMSGMGELHLEIAVKFLKQYSGKIELAVSNPVVNYRESILKQSKVANTRTSGLYNTFKLQVEPLETKIVKSIENGEPVEEKTRILALEEHGNILIDLTESIQNLPEVKESIISGFRWVCTTGPLCEEPLRGVKAKLIDAQIHEDPSQCDSTQIKRAISRAILGAVLTAKPVFLEPMYKIAVSTPTKWFGACSNIIIRKRGKISASEQKGALTTITGYVPVSETFGLSAEMRSATSGHAFWQCVFDCWERVPEEIANKVIKQIREKRGLPPEVPKPEKFMDEP